MSQRTCPTTGLLAITLTAAATLLSLLPGRAAGDVRDGAEFFSPAAERRADERMQKIRQQYGKDVIVETVPTVAGVPAQAGQAREDFFEREVARRGREAGVNGLLVFVSKEPSYFYIGIDPETQRGAFTPDDRRAVRDAVLARFKAKDFDGGLATGLDLIEQRFAAHKGGQPAAAAPAPGGSSSTPPAVPTGTSTPAPTGRSGGGLFGGGIMGWMCLIIGALLIFTIVRAVMRRGAAQRAYGQGYGGQPGGPPPQPGQPGYDPRYGGQPGPMGGGGGGFGRGILGGLLGGVAGGALYDHMRGGNDANAAPSDPNAGHLGGGADPGPTFGDSGAGGDFGSSSFGDSGGGGDFGGGDSGAGGDF